MWDTASFRLYFARGAAPPYNTTDITMITALKHIEISLFVREDLRTFQIKSSSVLMSHLLTDRNTIQ